MATGCQPREAVTSVRRRFFEQLSHRQLRLIFIEASLGPNVSVGSISTKSIGFCPSFDVRFALKVT
jgi:hypothetical protein